MTRTPQERLTDILEAIERARRADERLEASAASSDDTGVRIAFESVLHNLFVIGEAVKALPDDYRSMDPTVPWAHIAGMRDVIGHQYHRIVPEIIHRTVKVDLGDLEDAVCRIHEHMIRSATHCESGDEGLGS